MATLQTVRYFFIMSTLRRAYLIWPMSATAAKMLGLARSTSMTGLSYIRKRYCFVAWLTGRGSKSQFRTIRAGTTEVEFQ